MSEGESAPSFVLPGVVDGKIRDVDISDHLNERIVVLAFYPADFGPGCTAERSGLDELDLFTMQKDVSAFGISPDSVYSHRAFAERYSLSIPLLSDSRGEIAGLYGVRDGGERDQLLVRRSVFVIDHEGTVAYAWRAGDAGDLPAGEAVRAAVEDVGGNAAALGRYRVGHAHYVEGRRAFTSAMEGYEERDWLIARGDFERAGEEFREAADQFDGAARFADAGEIARAFERAGAKATALWQAAEWLSESADAFAGGRGREANQYRQDAESPLEAARDADGLPDPDDLAAGDAGNRGTAGADDIESPATPGRVTADGTDWGTGTPGESGAGPAGAGGGDGDAFDDDRQKSERRIDEAVARVEADDRADDASTTGTEDDAPAGADEDAEVDLDLTDPTDGS